MLEDKWLVLKCRGGNADAVCRIYLKYKDALLTLATALLGDRAEAEDVVHDVFVGFAKSAGEFRLTGTLRGYLATCVRNRALDRIRARGRSVEDTGRPTLTLSPDQQMMQNEELAALQEALSRIPYEQREVIMLHIKGQMTFKQIAKVQGIKVSTSLGRYRYGLAKLRALLNGQELS